MPPLFWFIPGYVFQSFSHAFTLWPFFSGSLLYLRSLNVSEFHAFVCVVNDVAPTGYVKNGSKSLKAPVKQVSFTSFMKPLCFAKLSFVEYILPNCRLPS